MQYRTTYKLVTNDPEPKTWSEIADRTGENILFTEIIRGKNPRKSAYYILGFLNVTTV